MTKIKEIIKENPITAVIFAITLITIFIVPIDKEYISYFDFKTLGALYCILVVIECLKDSHFFQVLSKKIIYIFKNTRSVILALVISTFICDLFLANDMSLITLLPLTCIILTSTKKEKYLALTLILQNIAANMSGMITPHGNPQNLYLYSYYNIPTLEFVKILLPQFFIVLILLIIIPMIFVKKESLKLTYNDTYKVDKKRVSIYLVMFVISLLSIFRVIPIYIGIIIITVSTIIFDRSALKTMDWDLLLTFCLFFIFSGNVSRIPAISTSLTNLLSKSVLITGLISCQIISNVPTAVLLSNFTNNYKELIAAVNIGSLGTLISSLASLITLKMYLKTKKGNFANYLLLFTVINLVFLIILLVYSYLFGNI
mgnify:FL=1